MELDVSDVSYESEDPVTIAHMNPLTENITAKNANSRLLRLPQELKTQIYELVLGGQLIHVHRNRGERDFSHYLCQAKTSEMEAHEIFATSKEPWFPSEISDRHNTCYDSKRILRSCSECPAQLGLMTELHVGFNHAILRCCRQTYEEARLIPFSANTWSFLNFLDLGDFCFPLGMYPQIAFDTKLAIRRLHLDIIIRDEYDETRWKEAFRDTAGHLKSLQYIYIDVEQRPWLDHDFKKWQFRNPAESPFFDGLMDLREFNLKLVSVTISDCHILHSRSTSWIAEKSKYRWTMAQKQDWAQYVEKASLRKK